MSSPAHTWTFRRLGGLDQATLTTAADLQHLKDLDPKLWVALSCPTRGLELPEATLSLLDADGDGRIRVADLLAAIEWTQRRVTDVGLLLSGRDTLPLDSLRQDTEEGRALLAAAVSLLAALGRSSASSLSLEEAERSAEVLRSSAFNGDGIIVPASTDDPTLRSAIADAVACLGGTPDRSGQLGVDAALIDAFFADFAALPEAGRLLRLTRDFGTLLRNFVNFEDFYAPDRPAIFQAGTLYLDTRSTQFCIYVEGATPLAAMSKAYIAYCDLRRAGSPPAKIAACFTQGDSDYLFVGRNGVFIDRQGRDWDATITSIVDNPISIRQAFSAPYKKLVRLIEEQVARRAAAADAASQNRLAGAAEATANLDKQRAPEAPRKVDVGAVAAIGVAVTGAVSVITLILGYLFGMKPWQYPLVLAGLIAAISGPSMLIAWLKIRQRTLGPILEGNGWAINGRVRINLPLGSRLTQRASLPPGTVRRLDDPYVDRAAAARRRTFILVVFVLLVAAVLIRVDQMRRVTTSGRKLRRPRPPRHPTARNRLPRLPASHCALPRSAPALPTAPVGPGRRSRDRGETEPLGRAPTNTARPVPDRAARRPTPAAPAGWATG